MTETDRPSAIRFRRDRKEGYFFLDTLLSPIILNFHPVIFCAAVCGGEAAASTREPTNEAGQWKSYVVSMEDRSRAILRERAHRLLL